MREKTEEHAVRNEKSLKCGVHEVKGKENSKSIGRSRESNQHKE